MNLNSLREWWESYEHRGCMWFLWISAICWFAFWLLLLVIALRVLTSIPLASEPLEPPAGPVYDTRHR